MNTPSKSDLRNAVIAVLFGSGILLSASSTLAETPSLPTSDASGCAEASAWTAKATADDSDLIEDLPTETPLIAEIKLPGKLARRYQIELKQVGEENEQVVLFDSSVDVLGIGDEIHELQIPFWTRTGSIRWKISVGTETPKLDTGTAIRIMAPTQQDGIEAELPSHQIVSQHPLASPLTLIRYADVRAKMLGVIDDESSMGASGSMGEEQSAREQSKTLAKRVIQYLHFQSSGGAIVDIPANQADVWSQEFTRAGLAFVPAVKVDSNDDSSEILSSHILERFTNIAIFSDADSQANTIKATIPSEPIANAFQLNKNEDNAASVSIANRCVAIARTLTAHSNAHVWLIPGDAFATQRKGSSPITSPIAWTTHPIEGFHDAADGEHGRVEALIPIADTWSPPMKFLLGDVAAATKLLASRSQDKSPAAIAGDWNEFAITAAAINRQASGIVSNGSLSHSTQVSQLRRRNAAWTIANVESKSIVPHRFVHQGEGICVSWDAQTGIGRIANASPWVAMVQLQTTTSELSETSTAVAASTSKAMPFSTGEIQLQPYEVRRFELPITSSSRPSQVLTCTCQRRVSDRQWIALQCEGLLNISKSAKRTDLQATTQKALSDLKQGRFVSATRLLDAADWESMQLAIKPMSPAISQVNLPSPSTTDRGVDPTPKAKTKTSFVNSAPVKFEWIGDFGPSVEVPRISRLEKKSGRDVRPPAPITAAALDSSAGENSPEGASSEEPSRGGFLDFWRKFPIFNR